MSLIRSAKSNRGDDLRMPTCGDNGMFQLSSRSWSAIGFFWYGDETKQTLDLFPPIESFESMIISLYCSQLLRFR